MDCRFHRRFTRRPWYPQPYLDRRCEEILFEFLNPLYGQVTIPGSTGAIIKLIERDARPPLDLYADLSKVEGRIWGVTFFDPPRKPEVRIAGSLYRDPQAFIFAFYPGSRILSRPGPQPTLSAGWQRQPRRAALFRRRDRGVKAEGRLDGVAGSYGAAAL